MRNPFNFFIDLLKQPNWVKIWLFALMLVNFASLAFWSEPIAKIIFLTFMASAILMITLYSRFGWKKILGLGHILWIPLLIYILTQIFGTAGLLQIYLLLFIGFISVSLAFDIYDVWQYFAKRKQ